MSRVILGPLLGLVVGIGVLMVLGAIRTPGTVRAQRRSALSRLVSSSGIEHLTVASLLAGCVGSAVVVSLLVLLITAVPVAALLAGAFAANVPVLLLRRRARVRVAEIGRSWPEAVDMLSSAIRAGMSLPESVIELGRSGPEPLRPAASTFASEYRATGSFSAALDSLQEALSDPVADRVVAALRIAREVGGSDVGVVLRTLSNLLREDARTRGEIQGRQSWTISAARLSVAAPWLTLALLCTRPEAAAAYRTPAGGMVLAVAAVVSLLAYRLMLRIGRLPVEARIAS